MVMPSALVLFMLTTAPCRGSLSAQLSGSELSFQSSSNRHYKLLDVLTHVDGKAEAVPQSRDICRYDSKLHHDTLLSLIAAQSYQLVYQEVIAFSVIVTCLWNFHFMCTWNYAFEPWLVWTMQIPD